MRVSLLSIATVLMFLLAAPIGKSFQLETTLKGKITDVTGATVPNAQVTLISTDGVLQIKSNSGGEFEFVGVRAGVYDLEVSSRGFRRKIIEELEIKSRRAEPLVLELYVGSTVDNCVRQPEHFYETATPTRAKIVGTVRDYQSASPVANVKLLLSKASETRVHATQLSDETGQFKFEGLEPGKYTLKAIREGYREIAAMKFWVTRQNLTRLTIEMLEVGLIFLCA